MSTLHGEVLLGIQLLDQPPKIEPGAGVAVSCTVVVVGKDAVQACPPEAQFMPAGLLVTVPLPSGPWMGTLRQCPSG